MKLRILFVFVAAAIVALGAYAARPRTVVMRFDRDVGQAEAPAKPLMPAYFASGTEAMAISDPVKKPEPAKKAAVVPPKPVAATPVLPLAMPKRPAVSVPSAPSPKAIPEVPIVMASVVVVRCSFENAATGGAITAFGSGAIVDPRGYVLTARHVVDMEYAYRRTGGRQGVSGYALKSCVVGGPDAGAHAPSPAEIRALNPFTLVDVLPYRADVVFIPSVAAHPGMSVSEADFMDMALLKIADATDDQKKFFGRSLPGSFPASRVSGSEVPAPGEEILTFGFPSGTPSYGSSFYLQGSVGAVRDYVGGDALFKDEPIGILADMETIGGRSGSPVFWRGRVIGVVSAKEEESVHATVISTYPLKELLAGSGIALSGL